MLYGANRAYAIGKISEEIVEAALKRCVQSGKIPGFKRINGRGVDFQIILSDQSEMELEVKSSSAGRKKNQHKYGKDTPVIIIRHNKKAMSMQERESHIFPAYLRIMNLVDIKMQERRAVQTVPVATAF